MSKRLIDTTFWTDHKIAELSALAKYLLVYLVTGPHGSVSGLYEITDRIISFDTGIPVHDIPGLFMELEKQGRVERQDAWVWVVNQWKHEHNKNNPAVRRHFQIKLELLGASKMSEKIMTVYGHFFESQPSVGGESLSLYGKGKGKGNGNSNIKSIQKAIGVPHTPGSYPQVINISPNPVDNSAEQPTAAFENAENLDLQVASATSQHDQGSESESRIPWAVLAYAKTLAVFDPSTGDRKLPAIIGQDFQTLSTISRTHAHNKNKVLEVLKRLPGKRSPMAYLVKALEK